MTHMVARTFAASLAAMAMLLAGQRASVGSTDERQQCFASYEQAQRDRLAGKLQAARSQLVQCARDECPDLLRSDCVRWLSEVEASLPTVVFSVRGRDGCSATQVRVYADAQLVAQQLDGKALALDPGAHHFRFELADGTSIQRRFVVLEGEKTQAIDASFAPPGVSCARDLSGAVPDPTDAAERPTPAAVYWIGGAGLAAVTVGAVFGAVGLAERADLQDCQPACLPEDEDTMRAHLLVADIVVGVGAAALVTAGILYLLRPEERRADSAGPFLRPALSVGGRAAFGGVAGVF